MRTGRSCGSENVNRTLRKSKMSIMVLGGWYFQSSRIVGSMLMRMVYRVKRNPLFAVPMSLRPAIHVKF